MARALVLDTTRPAVGGRPPDGAIAFDHARAAVSVRAIAGLVAKARDLDTEAIGRLDDRLARCRGNVDTVQAEDDRILCDECLVRRVHRRSSVSSCGKYLNTQAIGLGAA